MALNKKEQDNLKRYAFNKSDMLLHINETIDEKFCIRPVRWSALFSNGKLVKGNYLAKFDTKEQAVDALVKYCGYSKAFALYVAH